MVWICEPLAQIQLAMSLQQKKRQLSAFSTPTTVVAIADVAEVIVYESGAESEEEPSFEDGSETELEDHLHVLSDDEENGKPKTSKKQSSRPKKSQVKRQKPDVTQPAPQQPDTAQPDPQHPGSQSLAPTTHTYKRGDNVCVSLDKKSLLGAVVQGRRRRVSCLLRGKW